ncbi:MAG: hypothetical protein ACI4EG_07475 [Fusicatenibacter sp.]|nr:hypothetical protein [Fusicatenibacter sp.]
MNENAVLLNFIYQNSQMGVNTIRQLMEIVKDEKMREHLKIQLQGYEEFHMTAEKMLHEKGHDEKGISAMEKLRTYLAIQVQTMTDQSVSHIAEMMIRGSSMGVIDAIKKRKECNQAEKEIKDMMEQLQKFEEHNIEKLKSFL